MGKRAYYKYVLSKKITIRIDDELRTAIEELALASGLSVHEVIRRALREALAKPAMRGRIGHLRGSVRLSESRASWRTHRRERDWRP